MTRTRLGFALTLLLAFVALIACTSHSKSSTSSRAATGPLAPAAKADGQTNEFATQSQGTSGAGSLDAAPAPANAAGAPASGPTSGPASNAAPAAGPNALDSRDMVVTASIDVNVKDVDSAADTLGALARSYRGRVDGDDRTSSPDGRSAVLTLRFPSDQMPTMLDKAKGLGEELHRTLKGQDMTAVHADMKGRIQALNTSIDTLTGFLQHPGNIDQLIRTESELTQRRAERDSIVAQEKALSDQVALATLTVSLTAKPVLTPLPPEKKSGPLGFGSALAKGWHSVVTGARYTAAFAGYVLPYAVFALIVGAALTLMLRRRRPGITPPPAPAPEA